MQTEAIFLQADKIDGNSIEQIINQLGQPIELTQPDIADESTNEANKGLVIQKLDAPIQPWELDGFFKVNLDHYLYITTDLNLLVQENNPVVASFEASCRISWSIKFNQ